MMILEITGEFQGEADRYGRKIGSARIRPESDDLQLGKKSYVHKSSERRFHEQYFTREKAADIYEYQQFRNIWK